MKTSMSSVFIFVPPLVAWVRGQPVDDRSRTHACERPHTQRVVPLIGSHQRPAAAGDFRPPRIIYGQAQDNRAHSSWPGPGPPRTTNKVTGQVVFAPLMMSLSFSVGVCPFKTMRGRRLRRSWMAWTWVSVTSVKLVPLGR